MFVIVEIYNHAVICYPQGDVMTWKSREAATAYAEAISARNEGVFEVQPKDNPGTALPDKRTHGYRLSSDKRDPLKITGAFPL